MHNFKSLHCWQRSRVFCSNIYKVTSSFPAEERYGLTSQIRRATVSVSSNIAEGTSRSSSRDFARFLEIAIGSAVEVETQLILSHDLSFIDDHNYSELSKEVNVIIKQIRALRNKII